MYNPRPEPVGEQEVERLGNDALRALHAQNRRMFGLTPEERDSGTAELLRVLERIRGTALLLEYAVKREGERNEEEWVR